MNPRKYRSALSGIQLLFEIVNTLAEPCDILEMFPESRLWFRRSVKGTNFTFSLCLLSTLGI